MNTPKKHSKNYNLSANVDKESTTIGVLIGEEVFSYQTNNGVSGDLYSNSAAIKVNISPEEAALAIKGVVKIEGDLSDDLQRAFTSLKDYRELAVNAVAPIIVNIEKILGY